MFLPHRKARGKANSTSQPSSPQRRHSGNNSWEERREEGSEHGRHGRSDGIDAFQLQSRVVWAELKVQINDPVKQSSTCRTIPKDGGSTSQKTEGEGRETAPPEKERERRHHPQAKMLPSLPPLGGLQQRPKHPRDVGFRPQESGWWTRLDETWMDSRGFPRGTARRSPATAGGPQSLRSGMGVQEPSLLVPS